MRHNAPISCVATHRDNMVATAGYDNQVILWNPTTRTAIARAWHDHLANQCAFSSSGRWLVSASSDFSARIWDVPSLRLRAVLSGHEDDVEMAMFSPDESLVATCSRDRTVRIHTIEGAHLATLTGHTDDVLSVCWSHNGQEVVTCSDDGTVRRWDVGSATEIHRIDLGGAQTDTVVVAQDGTIFAGDDRGCISVVSAHATTNFDAHAAGIKRLVYDEKSRHLVSLSYDRNMAIWRVNAMCELALQKRQPIESVVWPRSAAFQGEDRLLFGTFGGEYHEYCLKSEAWDPIAITPTRGINAVAESGEHQYTVGDAGVVWRDGNPWRELGSLCNFLLPFGHLMLTGGQLGLLFDAVSGELIHQHRSPLNCGTTFKRDGVLHAAIGAYTGEALIFRLTGSGFAEHVDTWWVHDNAIKGLAAADGLLFSVCASGAVAFHHLSDGEPAAFVAQGHTRIANGCVAIRGGFASIGRDMKLRIWRDMQMTQAVETPHENSIKCICSGDDGTLVATGSYGGTVAIFDLALSRWRNVQRPTAAGISSLCRSSGGNKQRFLASSYDGHVYVV
jgi:toxoflavin biosynthesis protein ToxC